jgi:hypothetical protein
VLAGLTGLALVAGLAAYCAAGGPAPPSGQAASSDPAAARAMSAADLSAMWTRYGDAPGWHWTGGDRTVSVDLPNGQVVWLFSDTFLGQVNADGSRPPNSPLIHNSLVIQTRRELTATLHRGSTTIPKSLMCEDATGLGCWVGDAVVDGAHLRVLVNHYEQTGPGVLDVRRTKTAVVTLALPALTVLETRDLPVGRTVTWGQSMMDDGGYTYVYGSEQTADFKFAHLARVPAGGLLGPWQFWDGTGWSPDEARSARLASGVGTGFSVERIRGRYVLVSVEAHLPFNSAVVAYTADAPTGPFTDPVELFRAPETGDQRPVIVYDATLHPHLARPGTLLFSYNVNSLRRADVYADASLYRPRFVEVSWPPAAPDPARLPAAPQTLAARADADGRVRLSWAASPGPTPRYRVYQRDLTAGQIQWVRLPRPVAETSTDLDLLKNGHTYQYRVTAETPSGEGPPSAPAATTVTVAPPERPDDPVATAEGSGDVTLAWTAPRRAWHFVVERRDVTAGEAGFSRLDHPKAAESTLTATGLTHGHEYEFRVRAVGGGGDGPWSGRVRVTAWKGLPQPPAALAAAPQPDGTVRLTWTAPPGRVTYRVYQRDVTAGQATFIEPGIAVTGTPAGPTVTATAGGLTPGREYEFVVTATNRAGESGRSFPARATTRAPAPTGSATAPPR